MGNPNTKRFTFKPRKPCNDTIGIDATTLREAVAVYKRLRPDDLIAFVTTDPTKGGSRPVWLPDEPRPTNSNA